MCSLCIKGCTPPPYWEQSILKYDSTPIAVSIRILVKAVRSHHSDFKLWEMCHSKSNNHCLGKWTLINGSRLSCRRHESVFNSQQCDHNIYKDSAFLHLHVLKVFFIEITRKKAIYGNYKSKYLVLNIEDLITMKKFSMQVSKQSQTCLKHIKISHHSSPKQFLINPVSMLIQSNAKHNPRTMKATVILLTLYVILFTFLSLMNKLNCPLLL